MPGSERVFGLELPRGLKVAADFGDRAALSGTLDFNAAVAFFGQHVESTPIELGQGRAVFRRARIKDQPSRREYRIEVVSKSRTTLVNISDVTPPPVTQGLDEASRWKQAGRGPDGAPLDRLKLY